MADIIGPQMRHFYLFSSLSSNRFFKSLRYFRTKFEFLKVFILFGRQLSQNWVRVGLEHYAQTHITEPIFLLQLS